MLTLVFRLQVEVVTKVTKFEMRLKFSIQVKVEFRPELECRISVEFVMEVQVLLEWCMTNRPGLNQNGQISHQTSKKKEREKFR